MSIYVDKKYINLVSSSLDKFKWKSDSLANCRCAICGDSSKNKVKARGYFYCKGNDFFYKCHNCNFSTNLYNFLEKVSPSLCREYALERWKNGENGNSNYKKPKIEIQFDTNKKLNRSSKYDYPTVSSLDDDHICKKYVINRRIPEKYYDILLYAENFQQLISNKLEKNDPRLFIPVYDENNQLVSFQGRSLNNSKIKYITQHILPKTAWFGMNDVVGNDIFVFEGPIDSMFIPNSVATLGMSNWKKIPENLKSKRLIYVLDNEPRNKEVVNTILQIAKEDAIVCVWPDNIKYKDINEMILNGYTPNELKNIIMNNIFQGVEAIFKISTWRKCDV